MKESLSQKKKQLFAERFFVFGRGRVTNGTQNQAKNGYNYQYKNGVTYEEK